MDQRVQVAGVGSGFEATSACGLRDGESRQIARTFVNAGGMGVLGNFQAEIELDDVPATADGYVEVFDAGGADVPANMVVVPVVFGESTWSPATTGSPCAPSSRATPSPASPRRPTATPAVLRIFAANRNQLSDPNTSSPGRPLRVPMGNQI